MARFKKLCKVEEDCKKLVKEIVVITGRDDLYSLVDFYTPYTPTRLSIGLKRYSIESIFMGALFLKNEWYF